MVTIEDHLGERVPGCSGLPLPHLVVEIRDGDKVLPAGETGEITVRAKGDGPWAQLYRPMLGYLGHPESTAETVRDGVLYTGDVGHVDPAGRLFVRDRRNALILRGGANVYPAEVERVLLEAPGVRGASVVGVPDQRLGQRVAAAVEADEGCTLDVGDLVEPLLGTFGALQGARLLEVRDPAAQRDGKGRTERARELVRRLRVEPALRPDGGPLSPPSHRCPRSRTSTGPQLSPDPLPRPRGFHAWTWPAQCDARGVPPTRC